MGTAIGPLHVRRSILIEACPERVWQEFADAEKIKRWLNQGHQIHELEPQVGGHIRLSVEIDGKQRFFGGEMLIYDPPNEWTFTAQWDPPEWTVPTLWTFRLTALYGGTLVELFHHGFERLGTEAADNLQGYEAGWDTKHLNTLRHLVEG